MFVKECLTIVAHVLNSYSPLKTYNGHGVANQIKSLHAPIYSSRSGPEYLKSEELSYFDGRLEDPMEKPAIWVRPYNRDTELDGYSWFAHPAFADMVI